MARNWYILHTYNGYEAKIERALRGLLDSKDIDPSVLTEIIVPQEEVVTHGKDGKKKTRHDKFLPSYILLEMDLPETGWKDICAVIRRINGVAGFVGTKPTERPRHISSEEAKNILQRCGVLKGAKPVIKHSFVEGEVVKITEGSFASFEGRIENINVEKDKLTVVVNIFGRETPVEVGFSQVEKTVK